MKKISGNLQKGLNKQITAEFEAAYLYLSMANYLENKNFSGMARWFRLQAEEEKEHALKINDFLMQRGIVPDLEEIKTRHHQWTDVSALLNEAYRQECLVSNMIFDLVTQATEDKDFISTAFLQWFVDEQAEEEAQSLALSEKASRVHDNVIGLMILDKEMGSRMFE